MFHRQFSAVKPFFCPLNSVVLCVCLFLILNSSPLFSEEATGVLSANQEAFQASFDPPFAVPAVGTVSLRILSPRIIELLLVTKVATDDVKDAWNPGQDIPPVWMPSPEAVRVSVHGKAVPVVRSGARRRVLFADSANWDLRVGNFIALELETPLSPEEWVKIQLPADCPSHPGEILSVQMDSQRWSPVLHVNQTGYVPTFSKKAYAGYYLGTLGELPLETPGTFEIVRAADDSVVFSGPLKRRREKGWHVHPHPYQGVYEADFSGFKESGEYELVISGLGKSFPFWIQEGVAAVFARTYALGFYHQRCGAENTLPYSRFEHKACHTAQARIPTPKDVVVQQVLAGDAASAPENKNRTAPPLDHLAASLYPFVRRGSIDVSGGHHDAGDYSKYTINSAFLIHALIFAADYFPGVSQLDNLGLPESGNGVGDLLDIARWEADFLAKMQDEDGGFFALVYPETRPYELGVLPDKGDAQIVYPKTTAATAAAVAALAQTASSPAFRKAFPDRAAVYLEKALKGWAFVQTAIARFGMNGSYQRVNAYGDEFMHDDEIAWALTELYLATGQTIFQEKLLEQFRPEDPSTLKWKWLRLAESYGAAIRSYAFADRGGRLSTEALDFAHLRSCRVEIHRLASERVRDSQRNAYGLGFPEMNKRYQAAGWYFPLSEVFDLVSSDLLAARPENLETILAHLNYEAGTNPVNVSFITGLGWKRQREIVHQYAQNDRRVQPPAGFPLGSVQAGFDSVFQYRRIPHALSFPADETGGSPYFFYDRWADAANVTTEFTVVSLARSLAVAAYLMAKGSGAQGEEAVPHGEIRAVRGALCSGEDVTVEFLSSPWDSGGARLLWEGREIEPLFEHQLKLRAKSNQKGLWLEAEALWPDGRRVSAATECS